jgi:hypothetical protein
MLDRAREIVEALDATVPVEGAGVILVVDGYDWEVDRGYGAPFLATPAGFVRFGLQFMKTAVAASANQEHPPVDVDLDPVLRSDSAFEVELELLPEPPSPSPPAPGTPGASRDSPPPPGRPSEQDVWISMLEELDELVPPRGAQASLALCDDTWPPVVRVQANPTGLLRLGSAFARGAWAAATGKGRNRGERLELNLGCRLTGLEFSYERVDTLPVEGDKRRPIESPGCGIVLLILLVVGLAWGIRACLSASS